jgi:hypothetical protein
VLAQVVTPRIDDDSLMRKTRNAARLAGRADGRCWAEHTTEHELRRVAAIEFQPGLGCYKALCDAVDPDNEFSEMEIKRYLFGDESVVLTNQYFAAFIEGARQFFLEGAPKI